MLSKEINNQIKSFLISKNSDAIIIKGSWGSGKTYTWNKLLNEIIYKNKTGRGSYSYVSLFGTDSLDSLKYNIFESLVDVVDTIKIKDRPDLESYERNLQKKYKKLIRLTKGFNFIKNISPTIEDISFSSVKNALICIDDFERKGDGLSIKNIFGMIDYLKNQRNCKICIIINDEKMSKTDDGEYKKFKEKIVDIEIEFKPDVDECIANAFQTRYEFTEELCQYIKKLNIRNIRTIKKIEYFAKKIFVLIKDYDISVMNQALSTLCLYVLCYYNEDEEIPGLDYVKSKRIDIFDESEKIKTDEKIKSWNIFIRNYGYLYTDNFDLMIGKVIENGYIERKSFLLEAEQVHRNSIISKSTEEFNDLFRSINQTFNETEADLFNRINEFFEKNVEYLESSQLNTIVMFLRMLDNNSEADKYIDIYIDKHRYNIDKFNLSTSRTFSDKIDRKIDEDFAKQTHMLVPKKQATEVIHKISVNNSWNVEDIEILLELTHEDFFSIFKSLDGENLPQYIDTCLRLGGYVHQTKNNKKLIDNIAKALKKIAQESTLNKIKVKKYGINVDQEEPHTDPHTISGQSV